MFKVNGLQRRTEAHDIEAQLNALRQLQIQPAFIAGRQAFRKKNNQSRLGIEIFITWYQRIIAGFTRFCRVKFIRKEY